MFSKMNQFEWIQKLYVYKRLETLISQSEEIITKRQQGFELSTHINGMRSGKTFELN